MNDERLNERHDQARLLAEYDIGFGLLAITDEQEVLNNMGSAAYERGWDDGALAAWNTAIDKAQEELVRRDQFSERTLRILDELRADTGNERPIA